MKKKSRNRRVMGRYIKRVCENNKTLQRLQSAYDQFLSYGISLMKHGTESNELSPLTIEDHILLHRKMLEEFGA